MGRLEEDSASLARLLLPVPARLAIKETDLNIEDLRRRRDLKYRKDKQKEGKKKIDGQQGPVRIALSHQPEILIFTLSLHSQY